MATVQSQVNGIEPVLDDLPAWKKELILRRRANAKFHGEATIHCGGNGTPSSPTAVPLQHILPCLVQGPSQLSVRSVQGPVSSLRSVRVHKSNNFSQLASQTSEGREYAEYCEVLCVDKNYESEIDGKCTIDSDMRGPSAMHHKGISSPRGSSKEGWCNNDEEEFEYGPGIVSRLKNRYLSLALREAKGRASLRKYSSLEDLLDDGGHDRGRTSQKDRPVAGGPVYKESMKRARSMDSLALRRHDNNEKVPRSHSSGALRHALEIKEVIIIENPRPKDNTNGTSGRSVEIPPMQVKKQSSLVEEEELPAPDTVKQVKQIFESSGRASRGTIATKVASYKAIQARKYPVSQKPPIKAKPTQLHSKTIISPTIETVKASLKQVKPILRASPRSTLTMKASSPSGELSPTSPLSSIPPGLTPISASVTSPQINGEKLSPLSERHSKSNESLSSFPRQEEVARPRPQSPPPSLLPLSPTPTHKLNNIPKPKSEIIATHENERVLHENKKNRAKSITPWTESRSESSSSSSSSPPKSSTLLLRSFESESEGHSTQNVSRLKEIATERKDRGMITLERNASPPSVDNVDSPLSSSVLEVIRAAEAKSASANISPLGLKSTKGKDGKRNAQESSPLVFNFSKRTDTPDHIENDGVDLSKRPYICKHEPGYVIMPGYDGRNDSSTDGDDDGMEDALDAIRLGVPPPPCNITFEGEGVIINGRSNLQRQPRTKKLEVSFDMPSTSIFEYPSETCLAEELDGSNELSSYSNDSNSYSSSPALSTGGLATYTPSKLKLSDSFELGISRSSAPQPPTPPKAKESLEKELLLLQDHVRPADETQTVTWSAESAPDMLF